MRKSKTSLHADLPRLCASCLRRQGILKSRIGKIVSRAASTSDCEICEGRLSKLNAVAATVAEKLSEYEFTNFLVGTTLPQSMLDKEDEIRSVLRIRGREGIKTQITRTIGKKISQITGKKVEYSRPDLTVLVPLGSEPVTISPRSIWVSAKYLKRERGIPQKSKTCNVCSGLGCATCDFKGVSTSSVQSIANEFFMRMFKAEGCNFIWIGGEDENSLVLGEGRQFFVEVVRPKVRSYQEAQDVNLGRKSAPGKAKIHPGRRSATISRIRSAPSAEAEISKDITRDTRVEFKSIEILPAKPTRIPMFKVDCEVHLIREIKEGEAMTPQFSLIDASTIEKEFSDAKVSVLVSRKFRRVTKCVESIKVDQQGVDKLTLHIRCDGGIPIKKFLSSTDDSVTPNISGYLKGYVIDELMPFDILNVSLVQDERPVQGLSMRRQFNRRKNSYRERRASDPLPVDPVEEEYETMEAMTGL